MKCYIEQGRGMNIFEVIVIGMYKLDGIGLFKRISIIIIDDLCIIEIFMILGV